MEEVKWFGKMEENMKVNFKMIINMVMVSIYGVMVGNMKETGLIINNMEREIILTLRGLCKEDCGNMGKD